MNLLLRQSTAYTFRLGPFLDSTDGNTEENLLTITYNDVLLSKAGGSLTAKNDTTNLTSTGANAHYTCVLNAIDTGTLGALRVWCHISGALAVWQDFIVVPANIYDSLVTNTDYLQVDISQWLGEDCITPATSGIPKVEVTNKDGYRLSNIGVDDILDEMVENTLTLRQALKVFFSVLGGKSNGGGTSTLIFRDYADTLNRVSATVDENGNRTNITLNVT